MFEDARDRKRNAIYEIIDSAYKIEQTGGINLFAAMRICYAGLLNTDIIAIRLKEWDDETLTLIIWRKAEHSPLAETVRLMMPQQWQRHNFAKNIDIDEHFIESSLLSIFSICREDKTQAALLNLFEDNFFLELYDLYDLRELAHQIKEVHLIGGMDILPTMQLRYAGLLKSNVLAMRITRWSETRLSLIVWRHVKQRHHAIREFYLTKPTRQSRYDPIFDGRDDGLETVSERLIRPCIESMLEFCEDDLEQIKRLDVFEDSYFFLQDNRKIIQQEMESFEGKVQQLENDLNYYRTLAQDLAKYHAQDILAHAIQLSVASLEADTSNGIYGDETVNLWEEICIYQQSARSCNQSQLDDALEYACFEALKQLKKEQYIMLLMSLTDFEDDYYVGGDGCPEHWHKQATAHNDGIDKLLPEIVSKVLGRAVNNHSETIQGWLGE